MNKGNIVVNPVLIAPGDSDTPTKVPPILISNLGSLEREGTYSYDMIKEFNSTYRVLGEVISALRLESEYCGRERQSIDQALSQKVEQMTDLTTNFVRQSDRMHYFINDQLDSKSTHYSNVYSLVAVMGCLLSMA